MSYTLQIRRQLADSGGLIGYSMDANVASREFWTLSVWEDEESLMRFVGRNHHGRVMADLIPSNTKVEAPPQPRRIRVSMMRGHFI